MSPVEKLLLPYRDVHWWETLDGYITWRMGTGGNTELLHIHSNSSRKGGGTRLLVKMLESLNDNPPYCTVFGFCLPGNLVAHKFYLKSGFVLSSVKGVYEVGSAILFSQRYDVLCRKHLGGYNVQGDRDQGLGELRG